MARSLRDLRSKMKSIRSTRQVTRAMELVAASKMRRAVANAQSLQRYARLGWHILQRIAARHADIHPYLQERPAARTLAILFSTDRGLCGSLNAQLFRMVTRTIEQCKAMPTFASLDFVVIGRKGQQFLQRSQQSIVAAFPAMTQHPTFKDTLPIVKIATEGFLSGSYDHVVLLFPGFLSAIVQEPSAKVLLPFSRSALLEILERLTETNRTRAENTLPSEGTVHEYLFEPSEEDILKIVIPQLTEVQVYQALLDAVASEHSARMLAMHNATESASDIIDDLTLTYNQTRQANITAELAELSASAAALGA